MNGIEMTGFDELENMLQEMTITDADEKQAMKLAITPVFNEVKSATPEGATHVMKDKVTMQVKKEDFATVGIVKMGAWYTMFEEYGTSSNKKWVGFFERAVNKTESEATEILSTEMLGRAIG